MKRSVRVFVSGVAAMAVAGAVVAPADASRDRVAAPTGAPAGAVTYDIGLLGQPTNVDGRDAGSSGMVFGRSLWAFGDTLLSSPASDGSTFRTNTGAFNVPGYYPLSEPTDGTGSPSTQLVPFSSSEASFNAAHDPDDWRYAVWPSAVIPRTDGRGLVFFASSLLAANNPVPGTTTIGLADVNTAGSTVSSRRTTVLFGPQDCAWGIPYLDADGYLYFWADLHQTDLADCPHDSSWGGRPVGVARVKLNESGTRSSYRFWNGAHWVDNQHLATPVMDFVLNGPSVSYDATLGKYVAFSGIDSPSAYYMTAPDVQGPWTDQGAFTRGVDPAGDYRAWRVHPELGPADGSVVPLSYFRYLGSRKGEIRLLAVDVRSDAATHRTAYVDKAYQVLLLRAADASGRSTWVGKLADRSASLRSFARGLQFSSEGYRAQAKQQLKTVLGHDNDTAGATYWGNWLEGTGAGTTNDHLTARLATSTEFANDHVSDASFVDAMFPIALGRAADSSGRAYWINKLATGTARYDMVLSMVRSSEAGRYQARLAYQAILHRDPTDAEAATVSADYARVGYDPAEVRVAVLATAEAIE